MNDQAADEVKEAAVAMVEIVRDMLKRNGGATYLHHQLARYDEAVQAAREADR